MARKKQPDELGPLVRGEEPSPPLLAAGADREPATEPAQPAQSAEPPSVNDDNPMRLVELAVRSGADVASIEKMLELKERWDYMQAKIEFERSLQAFQAECPMIRKRRGVSLSRGSRPDYYYASYDDIMREVRPLLAKHGITVSFSMDMAGDAVRATCRLSKGVYSQESTFTCPIPAGMRVNDAQKMGSARSYARRYAFEDALNIVVTDEDDDGRSLSGPCVTEAQAIQLSEIASELPDEVVQRFFTHMGVGSFGEIPAGRFEYAKNILAKKLNSLRGGK
ncbi:MAG: hypothetical protein D6800_00035 [Candidatus Zixiibacteriota bacterium]|nr:MAG: hypothetical protein D6800_00035 [candidate division Zixibacteria bacterium]